MGRDCNVRALMFLQSHNCGSPLLAPGPVWEPYTIRNERIIQLNGDNTTMIPDTFRKEQMDFINSIPAVFLHRRDNE